MSCLCENNSTPLSYTFNINAGATFEATIFWQLQESPSVAPVAVDLMGYTAVMAATRNTATCFDSSVTPLFTLTTENGGITLGTTNGRIDLLIAATATTGYAAGPYVYQLDLTAADGVTVTRLLAGIINVSPAIPT